MSGSVSVACRFEPAKPHWIEAHGRAQISHIAASPRGVDGVGASSDVFHYPGEYDVPWTTLLHGHVRELGASPRATYVVGDDGAISVVTSRKRAVRWKFSGSWDATFVAADEDDHVFVIVDGRAFRVGGEGLSPLTCDVAATVLSANSDGVYVVTPSGDLLLSTDAECKPVATPGTVSFVTAYRGRLVVVVERTAYDRINGSWVALPMPKRYRDEGVVTTDVVEVAASAHTLWALDSKGDVFVLWENS